MKKITYISILIASIIVVACSTDLSLNAPYKDVTVVFGVLNPADTVQYIRINKAFLGETSAEEIAQNPDSIQYAAGTFQVTLEEWNNNNLLQVITLSETQEKIKDEGFFANSNNLLFKTNAPINVDYTYKLKILNTKSKKEITAETAISGYCSVSKPSPTSSPNVAFANNFQEYQEFIFKWTSAPNVRRYQLYLDFHYRDIPVSGTDTVARIARVYIGEEKISDTKLSGGKSLEKTFYGEGFYKKINEVVKYDPNVKLREIGTCDLVIFGAAEELSIYMDISRPSNTINQEKPEYTNLTNAAGIFSSRNTTIRTDIKLNQYTIKMFGFSTHTNNLNFCDPEPNPQTIPCN